MINPNLLQLVVNASNDGIVIAEREGSDNILIYVNPAFERMTGYTSEDILYQDCRFLQNGQASDATRRALRMAIDNGLPCRQVMLNFRKDGTPFWNELAIAPVDNEGDGRRYFIGIQKDVTDQVVAQERIMQLEQELALLRQEIVQATKPER
ncbi:MULTISPECIES: PAS domain-containing protein [Pseudomonas]|uniref:PAS domain-containing protein n=1 Tax=Pseudomonas quercus TaxID=2722792 RepID=A0ABX0YAP9_9PSED|nr:MULTISPECIES: PAS domain-containing protein [Pseudomonas]MBF7141883.1 PAS domain-containing protein [Pseudomonas sp. LY10J]NJP00421.1 PAS domain-containing protein [Pseudomonas quercus]